MSDDNDYQPDSAEIALEEGFTGSFSGLIEWLQSALVYGFAQVEEVEDEYGRSKTRLTTVTAGYSSDEHLLGALGRSVYFGHSWVSSQRGGRSVYEFSGSLLTNSDITWLKPADAVIETIFRVRTVRLVSQSGDVIEVAYDEAAQILFEEPDRDILEPAGVLTIRPITINDAIPAG